MRVHGRALVLATDERVAPFDEPAREAWFSGETVGRATTRALRAAGWEVVPVASPEAAREALARAETPALLLPDTIYVSEKAARDFTRAARRARRPAALALSINASVRWTRPLQDLREHSEARVVHDVLYLPPRSALPKAGAEPLAWLRSIEAAPLEVKKREIAVPVRLPAVGAAERASLDYPVTSTVVVAVSHWTHVLWLNQIAFGVRWMERIRRRPLWAAWRALSALSLSRHRLLDRLVHVGRGADVHPSARLSGTLVGEGAVIEAGATVKNAIIGPRAHVGAHAVVLNSVIGDDAHVATDTTLVSCVTYPDAWVENHKLQVSLLGRGSYVNAWAGFVDARFAGPVKVRHRGELCSTERSFIGSVVGHGARVAAKVLIQPGREIPNGAVVVMRPDEVVSEVPASMPAGVPHVRHRGTLVPLGEETR